jgi:Domain of unknown function (DUF4296)
MAAILWGWFVGRGQVILMGLLYVGCCLAYSCKETEQGNKYGVLSKQQLSAFLIEMYLAEARLDGTSFPRDSAIRLFIPYEQKLMKRFKVTDSTLKLTYQYYLDHPTEMEQVYDVVIDSLNLREQKTSQQTPRLPQ